MSFAVPRNVPNFDSAMRKSENSNWSASSNHPQYKDKPYGVDYNKQTSGGIRRRRRGLILCALALAAVYLMYQFGRSSIDTESVWAKKNKAQEPQTWPEKQQAVKNAFVTSWEGYRKYAWGKDVYHPISKRGENMGPKPMGWIIVDALDTLKIMGLNSQLKEAERWVKDELDYDMDYEVNTFETSIRMMGGLLSTYYLTDKQLYLTKALDLGNRIIGAFDSGSGIPYASVNLRTGKGVPSHADLGASSTAEAATVQLEFKYLSKLTGDPIYWKKAERVLQVMDSNDIEDGLVPIFIQPDSGKFQGNLIRLGSRGDSYYEYLIKQYIQTNGMEPIYKELYDESVQGIKKHLVERSHPGKLTYISELEYGVGGPKSPKMDELVCFAGGMLAIGSTRGIPVDVARRQLWTTGQENDLQLAREITRTCYEMYARTATGLAPEIAHFNQEKDVKNDFSIKLLDAHNLQRPETLESIFILWRLTKNPIYREWGWEIFKAFEKWTKLEGDAGYTSLQNVKQVPPEMRDNMESFWLSETLKYLYLLFDDNDDLLPLDKIVFNTEAHPLPIFSPSENLKTGWQRTKTQ